MIFSQIKIQFGKFQLQFVFLCCEKWVEKLALIKKYHVPLPKCAIFLQSKGNRTKQAKNVPKNFLTWNADFWVKVLLPTMTIVYYRL